ncbi:hypothetical protein POJ06DRAFT_273026 [Lipomyces tetrasporus]|uniref:Uncharacterized protein n=1 Tax=Lipomyces tetrasporus TaxID=54092 RepID=A0AAD7VW96_9ASCO|nr:uncharacterized protein POJ06DRAFT_273026 [Lipomyces tetrasporus]KAJ8104423.1 hypothetical protein POJ06DRAFT_273026 [Lipomyces tetrasporus]
MMFTNAFGLLASFGTLAAAFPTTLERRDTNSTGGGVEIINNMGKNIYLWSVGGSADATMVTLTSSGNTYSESWRTNSNGGGVSIKISTTPDQSDVLQYEYTLVAPTIYWDLSSINMGNASEFTTAGFAVTSNDSNCRNAICKPGDNACADAYLFPTDDQATRGCPESVQMTLNLGASSSN